MNRRLLAEGVRHPTKALRYLASRLRGERRQWFEQDGVITFREGGFAAHAASRAEFAAATHAEGSWIRGQIQAHGINHCLELGAGYGRLTPFIAEAADVTAIEPNSDAFTDLHRLTDSNRVTAVETTGDELPLSDNSVDAVVSWTVLMHIPPESLGAVIGELRRVLRDDGVVILCEADGVDASNVWGRSTNEYADYFGRDATNYARPLPEPLSETDAAVAVLTPGS